MNRIFILIKLTICFYLIFIPGFIYTQTITIHHPYLQFLFEDSLFQSGNYHSVFKPQEVSQRSLLDKFPDSKNSIHYLPDINKVNKWLNISPVIDAEGAHNNTDHRMLYRLGQGVYIYGYFNQNIGYELSAELFERGFPSSARYSLDSLKLIPGYNRILTGKYPNISYASVNGFIKWNFIPHMSLKLGKDKQFLGDGDRSLLLSEYAASYPFVQLNLDIWRIKYSYQLMFLQDLVPGEGSNRFEKYTVMHTLDYNISRNFNIYAFEAVVWRERDSTFHRGIDVNYLDPFLVFYPVDWSIGSPDHKLIGLGSRWQVFKHLHLYGQLLLGDFSTTYIEKYGWGWYGNKHGIQGGFKIYRHNNNFTSLFQMEYNIVRPYTYSHYNVLDNYGYLNRPLAHPYGANFREILAVYRLSFPRWWMLNTRVYWTRYGADPPGKDYGSNIYISDDDNVGISGNFVGQGILTDDFVQQLDFSRMIVPSWRLRAGITFSNLIRRSQGQTTYAPVVEVGLKTLLYQ